MHPRLTQAQGNVNILKKCFSDCPGTTNFSHSRTGNKHVSSLNKSSKNKTDRKYDKIRGK